MPTKTRSTRSSKKSARQTAAKAAKKVAKKVVGKPAKKAAKKAAKKVTKKAAKKVARKPAKKVARKAAKKVAKKAAKKSVGRPQSSRQRGGEVSAATRYEMIEIAAYFQAVRRNFRDGDPVTDWLSGEKEIDVLLASRDSQPKVQPPRQNL